MKKDIKILMIDDDEEDFIIMNDIITEIDGPKYTLEWVSSYREGLKILLEKRHDLYFIDFFLGANTGLDLIYEAQKSGCDKPLIILTGQSDFMADNKALDAGATDYLVKSELSSRSLETTIRYAIANANHKKEMQELNEELERRVTNRTKALEEILAELEISRKELSNTVKREHELNDMKSHFISTVSHEFRTPLTSILSSLFLVSKYCERNDIENHAKHITRITSSVNYLTDLLNDMLAMNILEEDKLTIHPETINIKEFIQNLIFEMNALKKANQNIIYTHSGNFLITNDKKILKHILSNLISNAIKFSEEGENVFVTSEINNDGLSINIKDKGIGISDKDQQQLFQRFYRGSNTLNIQGTGLGLSIVSEYLKLIDGKIELNSRLKEGTSIKIAIPDIPAKNNEKADIPALFNKKNTN